MLCKECDAEMINVGTEYKPLDKAVWAKGWICPDLECGGYGQTHNDGSFVHATSLTLNPKCLVHARIEGALDFKKGLANR